MQRLLCRSPFSLLSRLTVSGVTVSTLMCPLTPPVVRLVVREHCWLKGAVLGLALMLQAPCVCLRLGVGFILCGAALVAGQRLVSVPACLVKRVFLVCSARWRELSMISPISARRLLVCSLGSMITRSIRLPGGESWKRKLKASLFELA